VTVKRSRRCGGALIDALGDACDDVDVAPPGDLDLDARHHHVRKTLASSALRIIDI
jgi:hypothetical protein